MPGLGGNDCRPLEHGFVLSNPPSAKAPVGLVYIPVADTDALQGTGPGSGTVIVCV